MKTLTLGKIINHYNRYLTESELKDLRQLQSSATSFSEQTKELHRALFGEEWDFMADSGVDSKSRSRGHNPMRQEYRDRVAQKREAFGVSPLAENGMPVDDSATRFCEEVVRQTKNYRELLALKKRNAKQTVFVDMDNVLVNFQSGIDKISEEDRKAYENKLDDVPGIFALMEPMEGAIEGYKWLCQHFDTYILSTAPWDNPSAWSDKLLWIKTHLPDEAKKKLILSHNKHLAHGHFLIDDRTANGAGQFPGKHIHFGPEGTDFPDWKSVIAYMKKLA